MNAPDKAKEIKASLTLVISFLTALWGWLGWAVAVFIAAMAVDYITGTWAARARGEWSSAAARTFSTSIPLVIKWCAIGRWK